MWFTLSEKKNKKLKIQQNTKNTKNQRVMENLRDWYEPLKRRYFISGLLSEDTVWQWQFLYSCTEPNMFNLSGYSVKVNLHSLNSFFRKARFYLQTQDRNLYLSDDCRTDNTLSTQRPFTVETRTSSTRD